MALEPGRLIYNGMHRHHMRACLEAVGKTADLREKELYQYNAESWFWKDDMYEAEDWPAPGTLKIELNGELSYIPKAWSRQRAEQAVQGVLGDGV